MTGEVSLKRRIGFYVIYFLIGLIPIWLHLFEGSWIRYTPDMFWVLPWVMGYFYGYKNGLISGLIAGFIRDWLFGRAIGLGMLLGMITGLFAAGRWTARFERKVYGVVPVYIATSVIASFLTAVISWFSSRAGSRMASFVAAFKVFPLQFLSNIFALIIWVIVIRLLLPLIPKSAEEKGELNITEDPGDVL